MSIGGTVSEGTQTFDPNAFLMASIDETNNETNMADIWRHEAA